LLSTEVINHYAFPESYHASIDVVFSPFRDYLLNVRMLTSTYKLL